MAVTNEDVYIIARAIAVTHKSSDPDGDAQAAVDSLAPVSPSSVIPPAPAV
jgi:hypothetical protein